MDVHEQTFWIRAAMRTLSSAKTRLARQSSAQASASLRKIAVARYKPLDRAMMARSTAFAGVTRVAIKLTPW